MGKANEKANEDVTDEHVLGASIRQAMHLNRYVLVELDGNHFPVVQVAPSSMHAAVKLLKYGST